jgi:hypothetical protein
MDIPSKQAAGQKQGLGGAVGRSGGWVSGLAFTFALTSNYLHFKSLGLHPLSGCRLSFILPQTLHLGALLWRRQLHGMYNFDLYLKNHHEALLRGGERRD